MSKCQSSINGTMYIYMKYDVVLLSNITICKIVRQDVNELFNWCGFRSFQAKTKFCISICTENRHHKICSLALMFISESLSFAASAFSSRIWCKINFSTR